MKRTSQRFLISIAALVLPFIVPVSVLAQASSTAATLEQQRAAQRAELQAAAADKKETVRMQICEERKARITDRLAHIGVVGQRRLTALDELLTRIENFVQKNNLTVANYDTLKNNVLAKKRAALSARANIAATAQGFSCELSIRDQKVAAIKAAVAQFLSADQAYHDSFKNLIAAIKAAAQAKTGGSSAQWNELDLA